VIFIVFLLSTPSQSQEWSKLDLHLPLITASCYDDAGNQYAAVANDGVYKESRSGVVSKLFSVDTAKLFDLQIYFPTVIQETNELDWRLITVYDPSVIKDEGATYVWNPLYNEYRQLFFDDGKPVRIRTQNREAFEAYVFRGYDSTLYVAKRLDTIFYYDVPEDKLKPYVSSDYPIPPECGNRFPSWTHTTVHSYRHKVDVSGDQISVTHIDGKNIRSTYVLDQTQPCNQQTVRDVYSIGSSHLFLYDGKGRIHTSSDSGRSWRQLSERSYSVVSSNQFSSFIIIERPTNDPLMYDVRDETFKSIVVTDSATGVTDTLDYVNYNSKHFVGQGRLGVWSRSMAGSASLWKLKGPNNSPVVTPTHTSPQGRIFAHTEPTHQYQYDETVGKWVRRLWSFGPAVPCKISYAAGNVLAEFQNRRSLGVFSYHGPRLSGLLTDSSFVAFEDVDDVTEWVDSYRIRSYGASEMGQVLTQGKEIFVQGRDRSSWKRLDTSLLRSIAGDTPINVIEKSADTLLVLTDSAFVKICLRDSSVSEYLNAGNTIRNEMWVFHPSVTSVTHHQNKLVLGFGVMRVDDNPYPGPSILVPGSSGATDSLNQGLCSEYCIALASDGDELFGVFQRVSLDVKNISYGGVCTRQYDEAAAQWSPSLVDDLITAYGTNLVASVNDHGVVFIASDQIDSILVLRPPYSSPSWIQLPPLHSWEVPTCIGAGNEVLYVGTTNGIYKTSIPTSRVDVVTPKSMRVGMSIAPNPASVLTTVHIANYTGTREQRLGLYGMDGSYLRDYTPNQSLELYDHDLDLSGVPSGPYLLVYKAGGATVSKLMVVIN
jgi:hypothetical protein